MKFELGQTLQTKRVADACEDNEQFKNEIFVAFQKYINCDWGDTCEEDAELNNCAVQNNDDRILAKYHTSLGNIFIITEYDRSATTILFTNEY